MTKLSEIKPKTFRRVIDLVREAGVDVRYWSSRALVTLDAP